MSSTRRKQNKPIKSAFTVGSEGDDLVSKPLTRRCTRALAASKRRAARQSPEPPAPAEPLRRSTRKRKKKHFLYPTKTEKKKALSSESEDNDAESTHSIQSVHSMDVEPSSGLALLAEVSKVDQALRVDSADPHTPKQQRVPPPSRHKQPVKLKVIPSLGVKTSPKQPATILDVDVLRKLSIAKLISNFSVYSSMNVPKDAFTTTVRHSYSCTMLPGICNEKFCGLLADTKNQIKRHLLRHIGELLTMTTQSSQSNKNDNDLTSDASDAEGTPRGRRGKQRDTVTYAIPSGTRHVTVNLPKSLNIKESSHTVIRSSLGVSEVVLLPKGLVSLSSMMDELKPHQFGRSPSRGKSSPATPDQKDKPEEYYTFNDENNQVSCGVRGEERLVENFFKREDKQDITKDEELSLLKEICNTNNLTVATSVETGSNVIAPESQTVECDIEIRTKRKKYTKKYDLPREVGKCQRTTDKLNTVKALSQGIEVIGPPHSDHNYMISYEDSRQSLSFPHTDCMGRPLSEPELSGNESSYAHLCQRTSAPKIKRSRKSKTNSKPKSKVKKKEPNPPTEEDTRIKKQALDLLSVLSKKSKQSKGPFTCEICSKTVTAPGTLRTHYRSHAGIKPFECTQCSATFTRLHSLKYHIMIHNEQTRFMCDHCGREFRHSSHFREHLRRHTGEEPFGCTDCPLRFKTRNTYKRHLKRHHQKKLTAKGIMLIIQKD